MVEVHDVRAKGSRRLSTEHSYAIQDQLLSSKMLEKTAQLKRKIKILNQEVR